jgi:pilus assembly protein CpaF
LGYLIKEIDVSLKSEEVDATIASLLNYLKKSKQIIYYQDKEIYRPLAMRGENFSAIDIFSENKIYKLMPSILNDLLEMIDSSRSYRLSKVDLKKCLQVEIPALISEKKIRLNNNEQNIICILLINEILGLGPLELLLQNSSISDILVNDIDKVYIEIGGKLHLTSVKFYSKEHLLNIIKKIASRCGRKIDESTPYVDARLEDGSRVNAIIPPVAIDSSVLSIRRFNNTKLSLSQLVKRSALSPDMASVLAIIVNAKFNIIISGGTGSGKTTLLNALSWAIHYKDRIITIEDSAELQLQQPHVVRLETRNNNIEGEGAITQRDLIINALRMRPDRIILGEARGSEAFDLLQAMNTGHEGSMCTIHANSPKDALSRLANMIAMSEMDLSETFILEQVGRTINIIVQIERLRDGSRKVTSINQVYLDDNKKIIIEPLYELSFSQDGKKTNIKFARTEYSLYNTKKLIQHELYDYYEQLMQDV